ncbi:MAG TPA: ATP-grasp domain-containing protein [Gemmataceae bacterium]|jgi:hypothetical protein|nr:ATP-grasp domain-containing protein [Gemmataceae bacterium]
MRIFIYEHTCAAAADESPAAVSLRAEGAAMQRAIVEDMQRVPSVEVLVPSYPVKEPTFRAAARNADYSLIIAPEFAGILLERCRWVLEEGGRLLGPAPEAIAVTADKFAMFRWWQAHGVPTPETQILEPAAQKTKFLAYASGSVICKQRDGAGCSFARIFAQANWPRLRSRLLQETEGLSLILQPYIQGLAASVALLVGPKHCLALPPAAQHIDAGENLKYVGGEVPLPEPLALRAERIARRAIAGVSGLLGYIGVDVVLGNDGRDWAIEINPRLTTSYVGLRALAEFNLAEAMLAVVQGKNPREWSWRRATVRFRADGACLAASC